jgi:hypothetical protein
MKTDVSMTGHQKGKIHHRHQHKPPFTYDLEMVL